MSSAYPFFLWWSWECVLCLIIIIKPEVWIINHFLGLGHETMVCAVCLTMFLWTRVVYNWSVHDDVIKWKHFPRYWPFVRGIHRSPVNSPHKGQWRGALMLSLICVWIIGWVNNREAGDLRRYRAHYDIIVMLTGIHLAQMMRSKALNNRYIYACIRLTLILQYCWQVRCRTLSYQVLCHSILTTIIKAPNHNIILL